MRFGAHQTFHLRNSWLHKGLRAIEKDPKILFKDSAIEKLGMGKNMVESLKYWLEATQLAVKEDSELHMTEIASNILHYDPYLELDGTIQLIHYLLSSNEDSATVWHWFFNKFSATEFEANSLSVYLQSYISTNSDRKIKDATLDKDIKCLLRMYRTEEYDHKYDPETNNPSPFSRFKWIDKVNNKYIKRELNSSEISPLIFIYTLFLFWSDDLQEVESINIEEIASKENSPGLILGLSIDQCVQIIETVSRIYPDKYLTFNKSGGYFIVNINKRTSSRSLIHYFEESQLGME